MTQRHTLTVRTPGAFSTIQDKGRFGMRHLGIPWSGVLTPVWQQLANALVGNELNHAIIECFEGGLQLETGETSARIAVMGATDLNMQTVNSEGSNTAIKPGRSYTIGPNSTIKLHSSGSLRHALLAIEGLQVQQHLGSASTYAKASLGGIDGKVLMSADELECTNPNIRPERQCSDPVLSQYHATELRVILGPQDDHFSANGMSTFLGSTYTLTSEVDRMGARLHGPALEHRDQASRDIVSDAIVPGSIQVPGNGQPIVLLNDAHTAGGYPKIATVISIDLPLLGLRRVGSEFQFKALSTEEAIDAVRQQSSAVQAALESITSIREFTLTSETLLTHNLIDGVTDGLLS